MAPYVAEVPVWLAAAPPLSAVLMPDGEVAAQGEPGSGRDEYEVSWYYFDNPVAWHRYSADGTLLGSSEPDDDWQSLYMDNYAELKARAEADYSVELVCYGELVTLTTYGERWDQHETEIYDYHGNRLEIAYEDMWEHMGDLTPIPGGLLPMIHRAQQAGTSK